MADVFLPAAFAQLVITFDPLGIGSRPTNILTFQMDGTPTQENFEDLAGLVADAYAPLVSEDYHLAGVKGVVGDAGGPPYNSFDTGVTLNMAGNWAAAPPNCVSLIQKRTAVGGRTGRGRIFVPGTNELSIDAGGLNNAGHLILMQTFCDDLATIAATAPGITAWAVPHPLASATDPTEVTGHLPATYAATQRRRLRK